MKRSRTLTTIGSLVAALMVIALAYGLELWMRAARESLSMSFNVILFYLQTIAIHVILAISLLALHWLINSKAPPNAPVSWTILIAGALLTFFPIPFSAAVKNPLVAEWIQTSLLDKLLWNSILSIACAFITVLGGVGLLRKSKE